MLDNARFVSLATKLAHDVISSIESVNIDKLREAVHKINLFAN